MLYLFWTISLCKPWTGTGRKFHPDRIKVLIIIYNIPLIAHLTDPGCTKQTRLYTALQNMFCT